MAIPFYFLAAIFLVVAESIDDTQTRFMRWWKKEPEIYFECRVVQNDEGERLIAQNEGWQYAGYTLGDYMNIRRNVDKDGKPVTGNTFAT